MDTYEELREDIGLVAASLASYSRAVSTHADAVDSAVKEVWTDIGELRDELHAVANRLENLTTFVTTSPAEVAAAIVTEANRATLREVAPLFECSIDGCTILDPHVHDRDDRITFRGAS